MTLSPGVHRGDDGIVSASSTPIRRHLASLALMSENGEFPVCNGASLHA